MVRVTSASWSVRGARERSHTDRHRALLDAAAEVFVARGYAETTVAAITAAAGVSRATLYVYFASKDEIFHALAARVRDDFLTAQQPDLDGDDPRAMLGATIDAYSTSARTAGPLLRLIDERGAVDPTVAALAREISERPLHRFTRYLERHRAAGTLIPVAAPRVVAETIGYSLTRGALDRRSASDAEWDNYLKDVYAIAETLVGLPPKS